MSKGKEKVKPANSKAPAIGSSIIEVDSSSSIKLTQLQNEQIARYHRIINKPIIETIKESFKLKNAAKIGFISVTAAGNVLLANKSPAITYIFAIITCVAPALFDFEKNYILLNKEVLKRQAGKSFREHMHEISKFVYPGLLALAFGLLSIGLRIGLNMNGARLVSEVLLALGTFVVGAGQMLVNPLIRKEVARRDLGKLQNQDLTSPEVIALIEKEINFEQAISKVVERDSEECAQNKIELGKLSGYLIEVSNSLREVEKRLEVEKANRANGLTTLTTAFELQNVENNEIRAEKENAEIAKKEVEQENQQLLDNLEEQTIKIQELKDEIGTLNIQLAKQDANPKSNVEKYTNRDKNLKTSIGF